METRKKQTRADILNQYLAEICRLTGQARTAEQAQQLGLNKYLFIEYHSGYGGYRLVNIAVNSGGSSGAFGGNGEEPRLKYNEMLNKLKGIITGINAANTK